MTDHALAPNELIDIVCPKIRDLGWVFYFDPDTLARAQEMGLDGFRFYFLGRGGVLGDVEALVVSSAFGYFKPGLVMTMWDTAKEIVAPRDAGRLFLECAADYGRRHLADLDGLPEFCAALEAVNDAADPTGMALYSGAKAEPLVDDLPGRAMQLVSLLREFRGGAHLIAVRASLLDTKTAHFVSRPNDGAMFGWDPDETPEITDDERARMIAAEALTDQIVLSAYAVLDDAGQRALIDGLAAMETAVAG